MPHLRRGPSLKAALAQSKSEPAKAPEADKAKAPTAKPSSYVSSVPGGLRQSTPDIPAPREVSGLKAEAIAAFASKANALPGFRMLTLVAGFNPITFERTDRSGANLLRALVELVPGGALLSEALENHGIFQRAGEWLSERAQELSGIGGSIGKAIDTFLATFKWSDLINPSGLWEKAKRIVTDPIDRVRSFASNVVSGMVQLVREAILLPLAALAKETRGWDLLCAVLGRDPITGQAVDRGAGALIGGFMKLIGEEEVWTNIQKAKAVPRCFAWFKGAVAGLAGFVEQIPDVFLQALGSLELLDLVLVPRAFLKIAKVFGGFVGRFLTWGGESVWNLLEIVFDVVSPGAWATVKKTGSALRAILRDPMPFMRNLVAAGIQGFQGFSSRFWEHLKAGLLAWLTESLSGVYIPKSFALGELFRMALSVLGISMEGIRAKVAQTLGEPAMKVLETGGSIVATFLREGPLAAWDEIKSHLADLKDLVIGGITRMVVEAVVKKAIPKILAMFIPGAGFVSAILTIYDTVMVFKRKLEQIAKVVTTFVNSIVRIAAGDVAGAAVKVESVLAGLLGLTIGFVMGFLGLGKVADQVREVIEKIRGKVDAAIDAAIAWVVKMARVVLAKGKAAVKRLFKWWTRRKRVKTASGETHALYSKQTGRPGRLTIESTPTPYRAYLEEVVLHAGKKVTAAEKDLLCQLADRVDSLVDRLTNQAQADTGTSQAEQTKSQDEYELALQTLAAWTETFLDKATAASISTPAQYGPLRNGYGTSVFVAKLTYLRPEGQDSTKAPPFSRWSILAKRKAGKSPYYVRGHLLNNKLGGTADWMNLTPLTQVVNNRNALSMLNQFEGEVKSHLGLRNQPTRRTVEDFQVVAEYGQSFPIARKASKEVREIQAEELLLPKSIQCNARLLDAGKAPKPLAVTVTQDLDTNPEHYFWSDMKRDVIELGSNPTQEELELLLAEESDPSSKLAALKRVVEKSSEEKRQKAFFDDKALGEALWLRLSNSATFRVRF